MDMEGAYRARLLAAAPVAALLADWKGSKAVYWENRPQGAPLPDITLQIIVDERRTNTKGFDEWQPGYVQVDIRALSYGEAKAIKEAVIEALSPPATVAGVRFNRGFVTARSLPERTETQFIFRPSLDFTFHYATA